MRPSLIVADNFYSDPDGIRKTGLKYIESGEQNKFSPSRRLIEKLEGLLGRKITKGLKNEPERDNGSFHVQNSKYEFTLSIHHDLGAYELVGLVYLTHNAPPNTGTSFWKHRKTGIVSAPTPSDARRLGISVAELSRILKEDKDKRNKWYEITRVGNVYNRLVIFRAGHLHSATAVFGTNNEDSRLTQVFNFSTL